MRRSTSRPAPSSRRSGTQRRTRAARSAPAARARAPTPRALDAWVGRQEQLDRLLRFLGGDGSPVMVVWGPGGVGKTRLATELLARTDCPVAFVSLSGLPKPSDLHTRMAQALGLVLTAADTLELAWAVAQQGRLLLVLDNAEDAVEAVRSVVPLLLSAAPALRVLITSRELTRIAGEQSLELEVLGPQDAQLLLRTRATELGATLPAAQAAQLCTLLDHLPLALELAAARLRVMPAALLVDALGAGQRELLHDRTRAPGRRGLMEVLAASLEALQPQELAALQCCALMVGPVDVAFLADVLRATLGLQRPWDIIQSLRERSLVRGGSTAVVDMLDSVRALVTSAVPEANALRHRLAAVVADAAQHHTLALGSRQRVAALQFLTTHGQILESLAWSTRGDNAARLALAVDGLRLNQGPYAMHQALLEHARAQATSPQLSAAVCVALGRLLLTRGELEAAGTLLRDAVQDATTHHLTPERVEACRTLALLHHTRGQGETALGLLHTALDAARDDDHTLLRGQTLATLGLVHHVMGNHQAAEEAYLSAVTLLDQCGETVLRGRTLARLGFLAQDQGRLQHAADFQARALATLKDGGHAGLQAIVKGYQGNLARQERRTAQAEKLYLEALETLQKVGDVQYTATFWMDLGILYLDQHRAADAKTALQTALPLAHSVRDLMLVALVEVYLGSTLCMLGDGSGHTLLATAAARVEGRPHASAARILDMQRALALLWQTPHDLGAARAALARGLEGPGNEHVRLTARMLLERLETLEPSGAALHVAPLAAAFRLGVGPWVSLARRKPLQKILAALLDAHHVGSPASAALLVDAGWPGERILPDAAVNRLRVAITTLRNLGLKPVLHHTAGGYALDPSLPVVRVSDVITDSETRDP